MKLFDHHLYKEKEKRKIEEITICHTSLPNPVKLYGYPPVFQRKTGTHVWEATGAKFSFENRPYWPNIFLRLHRVVSLVPCNPSFNQAVLNPDCHHSFLGMFT